MRQKLDRLYDQYNRREYLHPDPLEFLYEYEHTRDREIVGLIASCLAYGKVAQILKSVSSVLNIMEGAPYDYLRLTSESEIICHFDSFVHRFARGTHLSSLLIAIKHMIADCGSIYKCFMGGFSISDDTVLPALSVFSNKFIGTGNDCQPGLDLDS